MNISSGFAATVILVFCILMPAWSDADEHQLNPYLVIDVSDGSIILANREFDRWYPASLTKLMTAYVTMNAINDKELNIGSPVRISKRARKMLPSRMGYKTGTLLRVDTALKIIIVKSANDVSVALAESVAGSVDKFVERMNQTAASLGLTATRFTNANGLHSSRQYSSARDLAVLSRRLLLDFPEYSHWFAIPAIRAADKAHYSYNLLLERYDGANGMKTGFVCASGYNMVASAKRGKRQLIAVILGEKSQTQRAVLAARLMTKAFASPDLVIGNILTSHKKQGVQPENQRPILCNPQAIKKRYEPGAGKAIIDSVHLSKRKISKQPTVINTGGIDSQPSKAYAELFHASQPTVAIPAKRPQNVPVNSALSASQPENIPVNPAAVPTLRPTR